MSEPEQRCLPPPPAAGRRAIRLGALLAVLLASATSPAWALPTPDMLIGLVSAFPLLASLVVGSCVGFYFALKRRLGADMGGFVAGALLGGVLLAGGLGVFALYSISRSREEKRIAEVGVYLRCDYTVHEDKYLRGSDGGGAQSWAAYGRFQRISMYDAERQFAIEPNAALISVFRLEIENEAGIPGFVVDGEVQLFEFVRRSELLRRLAELDVPDLYLVDFSAYNDPAFTYPGEKDVFGKFRNVYVIDAPSLLRRYVRDGEAVRRANTANRPVQWLVRDEPWVVEQGLVIFPGMTNLLDDEKAAELLADGATHVVAAFDSSYRIPQVYRRDYLGLLLRDVDAARVHVVDLNAPDVTQRLAATARELDGQPFIVVGISKYDYIYQGLDFAWGMWTRLGRDRQRFRLVGFTARLPEAVARNWVAQSRQDALAWVDPLFRHAIAALRSEAGLPLGASLFVLGALVRLLFLPIGLLEARARFLRKTIAGRRRAAFEPWHGGAGLLLRRLRGHGAFELAGGLLTLALVVPSYRLTASAEVARASFLWIPDLSRADTLAGLLVGAMVVGKLLADRSARPQTAILLVLAFSVLLVIVPSAVLLYAAGVLAAGMAQDLAGRTLGRRALARALLEAT